MSRKIAWPARSMVVADLVSILAGFVVFRSLCSHWRPEVFARWEWLRLVLGLCLLLPRNGFDILAQRCAVRHPGHVREWTALSLVVRLPLSIAAAGLFVGIAGLAAPGSARLALTLALSLPVQAVVPDLAARVQGRFGLVSSLQLLRGLIPALVCLRLTGFGDTPEQMATWLLLAECAVCVAWWADAAWHGGLPGGLWRRLARRGAAAIARRTFDQTLSRWLRVTTWNMDAVLMGPLAPEVWSRLAPVRSLTMTAVIPLANYLGTASPLLAREAPQALLRRYLRASWQAIGAGLAAAVVASAFAAPIARLVFGPLAATDKAALVTIALRTGPILILLLAASFWTSLRRDTLARALAAMHLGACVTLIPAGIAVGMPRFGYATFAMAEWILAIMCVKSMAGEGLTHGNPSGKRSLSGFGSAYVFGKLDLLLLARRRAYAGRSRGAEADA